MEPHVGIIFLAPDDRLHIDSTPAAVATPYGNLMTHEKGHPDYWEELQRNGLVPKDFEYDEVARGRVTWNPRCGIAFLMLDHCILRRPDLVKQIREAMHLPLGAATEVSVDSHYVCPGCRARPAEDKDDW